jgi:hypothetical protein
MDMDTVEALQSVMRMIENVNDRSMLNGLSLDLATVVAVALRRQGLLSPVEVDTIEQAFANTAADWPDGQATKARELLDMTQKLWAAADPR